MAINLVEQPEGSRICGQCCVAMVAGIPIDEAINTVGKRGSTTWKDLRGALRTLRVEFGDLHRGWPDKRNTSIIKIQFNPRQRHFIVLHSGFIFDPCGWIVKVDDFPLYYDARALSHLNVKLP